MVPRQVQSSLLTRHPFIYATPCCIPIHGSGSEVITYDAAVVGPDGHRARGLVRPGLTWIGEPDWAPHLAPLPFAADLARHRQASCSPEEFAATMPDAWLRELSLAGTPDEVRTQIAARHAAGATSVVMVPAEPDPLDALPRLAQVLQQQR
ncbi:hypothetical protein [Dactylosporangium sp. CA-233914]|uniref:hypothetical protein n=1 Tax=Dactylosporangium sp. CA-233914 TaxID=3239934 RepID=UPI003D906513